MKTVYRNISTIKTTPRRNCWRYTACTQNYRGYYKKSQHLLWGKRGQTFAAAVYQRVKGVVEDNADWEFSQIIILD